MKEQLKEPRWISLFVILLLLLFTPIAMCAEKSGVEKIHDGSTWEGQISDQQEEFINVIDNSGEWNSLWRRAFKTQPPDIDFRKYVVACVFLGHSANWLYSIDFGKPLMRGDIMVIPFALNEIILKMSGPFKASGQYHMAVFEKKSNIKIIMEKSFPVAPSADKGY